MIGDAMDEAAIQKCMQGNVYFLFTFLMNQDLVHKDGLLRKRRTAPSFCHCVSVLVQ